MVKLNGFCFGWLLSDTAWEVSWLAQQFPDLVRGFPSALITCHDSNRYSWLHSVYYAYRAERPGDESKFTFTENGVLISGSDAYDMFMQSDFFGISDEIWFSNDEIVDTLRSEVSLTSEAKITDPNDEKGRACIVEWMVRSNCVLGVGDGYGINYATTSEDIAQMLEQRAFAK